MPGPRRRRRWWQVRAERGAATVLVVGLVSCLLVVTMGGVLIAGVVVASHRARLAADLAAIAGAVSLRDGVTVDRACAVANQVVTMNGAGLVACASDGLALEVTVSVAAPVWPEPAQARARAGPAGARPAEPVEWPHTLARHPGGRVR